MKRLSFNDTSNNLQATIVEIEDNEFNCAFATSPKFIALIVFNRDDNNSYDQKLEVRIFDRQSGFKLNETSCESFVKARSLHFHPVFDNLLFIHNDKTLILCDLERHLHLKSF